ncbi:hypothetical protein [Neptunomonas sp.]|uniref:hypothetical protein n=1 Tax=Neptunomonas sp. TaxID=1971898 RepID=UPI0025F18AD3|nr:hypothetical protein [Neptunomonas sp.]
MRFIPQALVSIIVAFSFVTLTYAGASYEGPESVPIFHPLCLKELKAYEEEGGAFDMYLCSEKYKDNAVKQTPSGGYYARRPVDESGNKQGYVVFQPVGTLDNAMELLLVHDKQDQKGADASVYVIGRIPHLGPNMRDFITSIGENGDRCNGGIQSARLVSEAILEVDINVNPATLMSLDKLTSIKNPNKSTNIQSLSLKPKNKLDDRPTTCIGTVTKSYDLLNDKESYAWVHFIKENTRVALDPYQQCFDALVADFVKPPQTINMQDFELFSRLFDSECSN